MGKRFESADFKDSMKLRLDYNNMFEAFVGKHGLSEGCFNDIGNKISKAKEAMAAKRASGGMDWRDLPHCQDEVVKDILDYVSGVKDKFEAFVVLGIGGSALGPMAVQQAIHSPFYNELPLEKRGGYPKFYVADNVDPEKLFYLFENVDPTKCLFNVISKSGSTSETMSQFMIIKALLEEKLGKEEAKAHIVCTTDKVNGNLIKIATEENYKTFILPSGVGGRFSELTPVGLLPAAMCGIDIEELLAGAAYMDGLCKNDDIFKNPGFMFAILNYLSLQSGKNMVVLMPYADSLKYISDWFAQLWAESLGKKFDLEGNVVNV
ncbi:MAG: glucose-6-phosphate isomerase, partial [Clostridiales bacterium]|nr:glucose-6-phosphate isomerase [Clostridiales bacterium]